MSNEREGLEWAEFHAVENMKGRYLTADVIAREANLTFALVLAGVGGGLAYAVRLLESGNANWLFFAVMAATFYMLAVGVLLVTTCLMVDSIPAIYQEPENIDYGENEYLRLRRGDLRRLQASIVVAARRNDRTAASLNKLRLFAISTPLIFIVAGALGYWLDLAVPV